MAEISPVWIIGATRSGKTTRLIALFTEWLQQQISSETLWKANPKRLQAVKPAVLFLSANGDNRLELESRLASVKPAGSIVTSTTPLGFFEDEVVLFWPLLIEELSLKSQFPIRLHPESEQELAASFWQKQPIWESIGQTGTSEMRIVRQLLDLMQLAAFGGTPTEEIPTILTEGLPEPELNWSSLSTLLPSWQRFCLEQGLLTYGIITELYWRYLLPNPLYQRHLKQRYQAVFADDVDEYPAIARHLFEVFLHQTQMGAFTYNPDGAIRLGLGADPQSLAELQIGCQIETLSQAPGCSLVDRVGEIALNLVQTPLFLVPLPDSIQALQTTSRANLLRQVAEQIIAGVESGQIHPQEIALIAPGVDAIARYTLSTILTNRGIAVKPLHEQRPLISVPLIRSLLTLLSLIYPGLGRLIDREAIFEMLVILSQPQSSLLAPIEPSQTLLSRSSQIDPVRAGLIVDHCFDPHPDHPRLLPIEAFPRWDRLGYQTANAYAALVSWIEFQRQQQEQHLVPSLIVMLDRAIQQFLAGGTFLPYDQLAALRELLETAQHYWEVQTRLQQAQFAHVDPTAPQMPAPNLGLETPPGLSNPGISRIVGQFIQLLRRGAVTANPYPLKNLGTPESAVILSNVFQYRSHRSSHRWQFWLDAGSPRWLSGSDALFGAPLFLRSWSGYPWTETDRMDAYEQRLKRIMLDLLGRATERVYLCYSDLSVTGQEQMGPLLSLVNAALPLVDVTN